jgi:ParB-like chromosome segregation protein Spo0J
MSVRVLEALPIDRLHPWPRNARTHSPKQIRQITASIRRFGFTNPVLIDSENRILAGHGRVEGARALGITMIPCLRVDHLSAAEKRAYVLADNKIALNAGRDEELLALELKELTEADIDFDAGVTGFSIGEIDQLVEALRRRRSATPLTIGFPIRTTFARVLAMATSGGLDRIGWLAATRSTPMWSPL